MGWTASDPAAASRRNALMIAGVAAIAMALIPGMPPIPFVLVGAGLILRRAAIAARQQRRGSKHRRGRGRRAEPPPNRIRTRT